MAIYTFRTFFSLGLFDYFRDKAVTSVNKGFLASQDKLAAKLSNHHIISRILCSLKTHISLLNIGNQQACVKHTVQHICKNDTRHRAS